MIELSKSELYSLIKELYSKKSTKFSFKYLIYSFFLFFLSLIHSFLNMLNHRLPKGKLLFLVTDFDDRLFPSIKMKDSISLLKQTVFSKKSFFVRFNKKNEISFNSLIKFPYFNICFSEKHFYIFYAKYMKKNYDYLLNKSNFNLVILSDEYSLPGIMLVLSAKLKKIKVFAVQHGSIHNNHPGYVSRNLNYFVMPDKFLVYGIHEENLLIKNNWNEKIINVIGCPRYDFLSNYKLNKNKLKKKLGIPLDKKILFWPTQTHDKLMIANGERDANTKTVMAALKNNPDWFLLLKFHPNENINFSTNFYNDAALSLNLTNIKILPFSSVNTFDCICFSDAVILKHTTVGMEAILMNKALINLELKDSWDLSQFKDLKSALIVKNEKDLSQFLKLVCSQDYQNLFKLSRKKYVKEHFANFGSANKELFKLIKNVI